MSKSCLVGQSGGPTAVINSSLLGVIRGAEYSADIDRIYGAKHGIEGILNDNIYDLTMEDMEEIELIKYTPSSILGSCRYQLADFKENESDYKKIFNVFSKYDIGFFFYIGGNDSMDTVMKLNNYAQERGYKTRIIGIPKTIDNDLIGTDHCPGYGSAAKYIATGVMEIIRDAIVYNKENVHIIEVMGRHTGWLAAASVLAQNDYICSPELIYLPELPFDKNTFIKETEEKLVKKKKVSIVVAEGIKDIKGRYIFDSGVAEHDEFGHSQMGGVAKLLGKWVKEVLCNSVKTIELNIMQRAALHSVSGTDLEEAFMVGIRAVKFAIAGETGKMVALKRINNNPYRVTCEVVPVEKVANREKKLPSAWIDYEKKTVKKDFIEYILPLIQGEVKIPTKMGLPRFAKLSINQ